MRLLTCALPILLATICLVPAHAQEPQDPTLTDKILKDLNRHYTEGGDRSHASLCPVCGEPMYRHAEPGFRCEPPGGPGVQRLVKVAGQCPHCQAKIVGSPPGNVNARGGLDRDFCPHSVGQIAVPASVWLCPNCGYAAAYTAFTAAGAPPVSPAVAKYVEEKLKPKMLRFLLDWTHVAPTKNTKYSDFIEQSEIPDWVKYEHALQLLELEPAKTTPTVLANLRLGAAHACRRFLQSDLNVTGATALVIRADAMLQRACRKIRETRKDTVLDPLKNETDEGILEEAARTVLAQIGKALASAPPVETDDPRSRPHYMPEDLYLVNVRRAGSLDRLGRIAEARKALQDARAALSNDAPVGEIDRLKIQILDKRAEERQECLDREREHLYQAAQNLMTVLYYADDPKKFEPIQHAYLLGELFRRDGREPASALAWYRAAQEMVKPNLALPDGESKWTVLAVWSREQALLVKDSAAGVTPGVRVRDAIAKVLERAGLKPAAVTPSPAPGEASVPAFAGRARSRAELFGACYAALQKCAAEKKAPAASVQELIKEGYLAEGLVRFDNDGRMICPESGKALLYSTAAFGDKARPLIYPRASDANQTTLYGDGRIGEK